MDLRKVFDQTVRDIKREVNKKVLKVPEIEQKVLDATSNEPWGPHGTLMAEIAQATRNYSENQMVMAILWRRMGDSGKNWRHVYKALTVIEYLVANGTEKAIEDFREHTFQIQSLSDFQYVEPNGKDQGVNIRKKSESLVSLLNDNDKIREVRKKAAANRDKYQGLSSTGGIHKFSSYSSTSGGGFGSEKYSNGNGSRYRDDDDGEQFNGDDRSEPYDGRSYDEERLPRASAVPSYEDSFQKKEEKPYVTVTKNSNRNLPATVKSPAVDDFDDFNPRAATAAPAAPVTAEVDFFSQTFTPSFPHSNPTVDFFAASDSAVPAPSDPFADQFGAPLDFFAAPVVSSTESTTVKAAVNPFDPFEPQQLPQLPPQLPQSAAPPPFAAFDDAVNKKSEAVVTPQFSSMWADSLSSGLIDLNISQPKSNALGEFEENNLMLNGRAMGTGMGMSMGMGMGMGMGIPPPKSSNAGGGTDMFPTDFFSMNQQFVGRSN